jgi:hypothetical protein
MPSPQAKPLHGSTLRQELLQRMERAHYECPTTKCFQVDHAARSCDWVERLSGAKGLPI